MELPGFNPWWKDGNDIKTLFKFLEKNNLKRALLITLDTETEFQKDKLWVEAIPYWRYWSIKERTSRWRPGI